ncbi:hypothetical protein K440DRAFT_688377 [Wilcoxina mikolae CBS 423.85]|nr:hypothetical protein K440DRAFT_688377 [Wilcoxina mikolae CBS 423.85]
MEMAELVGETISRQHRNQFPLPNTPGAPTFRGQDVTTFLHNYESLAAFTATGVTESNVIAMFPYYSTEEMRETAALKKEMLGLDETESVKLFLRTYDHISGVVIQCRMMCEYERTEMLLRALPKRLWRKAVTKPGMHPLEPSTFDYGKLHSWVTATITAAETLAMFEFMAPKSPAPTDKTAATPTASTAPTTSPALPDSAAPIAPMAPPTVVTSPAPITPTTLTAPTASVTPMAPTIPMAHRSPAATDMTSTLSGTASPMTSTVPSVQPTAPMTSENLTTLTSPTTQAAPSMILTSPTTPIAPMAPIAPTAFTPPTHTHMAKQGTIRAGPTVRVGIIRAEPPQGQKIRRHHYAQSGEWHCAEIPLEPAHRDYSTIKDYARAGAPILSAPSPAPAPSPASQPAPPPPSPPAQSSRTSVPLLSPEQLTQLMREVTEHFAQSRRHEVAQEPLPPPAVLSRTSVPLPSPEQLTQLVQEVTEHFAQAHP